MIDRIELEKHIPDSGENYDVIVCGGGPAGFGAAVASSLNGAKTLLIEARAFLGGVAGTSLFMPMNRLLLNGESRGGVHELLVNKLYSYGEFACRKGKTTWTDGDGLHVHPDYLKLSMLEILESVNCDYRLNTPVVGAEKDGNKVTGVKVGTKNGIETFHAKVFIDCTGDGDLSYYAGAEMVTGREEDGLTMPVTLGFSLANVDTDRLFEFYDEKNCEMSVAEMVRMAEEKGYTVSPWYSFDRTTIPGVVSVNNGGMKHVGKILGTDPKDSTLAERIGIQIAIDFVKFARELKVPGLENCYLDRTGAAIGVRETRRAISDYVLTNEDAKDNTAFPDPVAKRYGAVDQAGLHDEDQKEKPKMHSGHQFPYRALLVKGLEGLMVAGRCGSFSHMGLASGKSMGNMMAIGQAAGCAAAASVKANVTPRNLPYEKVKESLENIHVNVSLDPEVDW